MKGRLWTAAVVAALVTLTACGSNSSGSGNSPGPSGGGTGSSQVMLMSTSLGSVMATSAGRTIYWFAADTPTTSNCTGACATFWPPVKGPVTAASGSSFPDKFGTITRSDGTVQATYDGHPLYTYSGDTASGQTNGNALNISGGLWWAMTATGATLGGSPASPSASTSSVGGYGY